MAKQVDNRVVQMQFDNKKFEQGVQQTLKSINHLDEALNSLNKITLGGFEKIGSAFNKIDFSGIGAAADAVSDRMSAMGIVGATVLQNLTNSAINAAKQLGSITIGQIMSGGKNRALNLEQAKFQLEGLGVSWDSIKDNINTGVQDTAYGLDAAAKVASQLVASSVQIGDEMEHSLVAISGVAAMTNSSYEDIGQIFTTIAGNGRLMGMQLTQLATKGLNVAASLGQALGKSEAEIREMVSKGQIDFKTFSEAMYDAFGEHAKEANKTFTGSLSNMKAALSRIGAEFYTPGLEYARDIFNSITGAVNQLKKSMTDYKIFEYASDIMSKLTEKTTGFFKSISDQGGMNKFAGGALKTAKTVLAQISTFLNKGLHTKTLDVLGIAIGNVWKMVRAVFAGIKMAFPYDIMDVVEKFITRLTLIVTEFDKQAVVYEDVRNTVAGLLSVLKIVLITVKDIWSAIGKPVVEKLIEKIKELLSWTSDLGKKIKEFADNYNPLEKMKDAFSEVSSKWRRSIAEIEMYFTQKFGISIPEIIEKFKKKLISAFSENDISKEARKIAEGGNNPYAILAKEMGKSEEQIHEMIKNGEIDFNEFADIMNNTLGEGTVKKKVDGIELLSKGMDFLTKAIERLIDVAKFFYDIFSGMKPLFIYVGEGLDYIKEKISSLLGSTNGVGKDFGSNLVANMSPGLKEFLDDVKDVFDNFKKILADAFAAVKPAVKGIMNVLKTITFEDIWKSLAAGGGLVILNNLVRKIRIFVWNITSIFKPIGTATASLKGTLSNVSTYFSSLTEKTRAEKLKETAIAIGILAASILVLSSIDTDKLEKSMAAITALIAELMGSFYLLNTKANADAIGKNSIFSTGRLATFTAALIGLSVGLLIMASALKKVSKIDPEILSNSFFVLSAMLAELTGSIYLLSRVKGNIPAIGGTLLGLSVALLLMASALTKVSKIESGKLLPSIAALTMLLADLVGTLYLLSKMSNPGELAAVAASLILISVALNLLMIPLTVIALMQGKIGTALVELTALLTILGVFAGVMAAIGGGGLALAGVGAGLMVLAVGLTLLMVPLLALTIMGDRMKTSIEGLAMLLVMLTAFTAIMGLIGAGGLGLAAVGAGLIVFAAGLTLLMIPLMAMASMNASGLLQAIETFKVILGILGVVILLSAPLSIFAVTLGAVGVAILVVAAAVLVLGTGVTTLGTGLYLVMTAFNIFIETLKLAGDGIVELAVKAAQAIIEFLLTLGNSGPQITEGIANLIVAACDAILKASVKIVDTIGILLIKILDSLTEHAPIIILDLLELVFYILDGLLKGLTDKVPILARDLYNFCMAVLDELVKLIKQTPMDLFDIFFGNGFQKDKNSGKKLGEWFKGLFNKEIDSQEVQQAGKDTGEAVTDATAEAIGSRESQDKVNGSMDSLMSGMSNYISGDNTLSDAMSGLSEKGLDGLEEPLDIQGGKSMATYDIAGYANEGFLDGAIQGSGRFFDVGEDNGSEYIKGLQSGTGVNSPSWKAMEVAEYVDEGFAIGIKKSNEAEKALERKGNTLIDALGETASNISVSPITSMLSAFSAAMSSDTDYQPVISPILDLSNVHNGFGQIDSMFNNGRSFALAGEASMIQSEGRRMSMEIQNGNSKDMNQNFNAIGTKLDRLGDAILSRQIVLDSGEIVGGLADPMDRTLGVRAIRAQRGGRR